MKPILFLFITCLFVNIHQVTSIERDSSTNSFSAYIHKNYDILFQSPQVQHVEKADFYLLVAYHDSIGHQHMHSVLINQYAHTGDVVLVEGVPSGQPIEAKDSLQSSWITAPVSILGWDAGWMKDLTSGVAKNQTKVFLIAGLYHLRQPARPPFDDPNYSLAPLYEFLNEHRAVILLPKQSLTEQWNAFYLRKRSRCKRGWV
jgi:hypothetical protein